MKFGGTSVEDAAAIDRVAAIVKTRLPERPFVVVSAMARVTDQLLAMAAAAGRGERDQTLDLCRHLRERHYLAAGELLGTGLHTELHGDLGAEFDALDELLRGIAAVGELTPRTSDYVVSFGERLSSMIATAAFLARGIPATLVDARQVIITDAQHGRAVPQVEEINDRLQSRVKPLLEQHRVPIMGGFIGATREGIPTTIGRGGSDFSAALVGAGLDADRIEIWTDVDGMKTTDPRICPEARRIKLISFEEAAELAYFGAKVLASGDRASRSREEHSSAGAELAQPVERGHAHPVENAALAFAVQGNRRQEPHHHCRNRCRTHAHGPRLSGQGVRSLRAPPLRG